MGGRNHEDSFISQSSLSKHIRILEKELGTQLFIRTTRSIRLTEAGIMFLPYAKKIIGLCDSYSSELELFSSRDNNKLVVGIISNPQYYDLAGLMVGIVALSFTAMKRMDVANKLFMIADVLLLTGLTILLVCICK